MKPILPLLLALVLSACAASRPLPEAPGGIALLQVHPAADGRVLVMGRHAVEGDAIAFSASGVTFFLKLRGTALEVDLDDEHRGGAGYNWFSVVVDGGEPTRFRTEPGKRRYTLAAGLPQGVHTVALSKATEGQNGRNRLVAVHAAELLAPDPLPPRRVEYIGNSITAGYGADARPVACNAGTWFDQTHAWLAYGPRVARRVGAQWMLSAVSGIGMVRNWNSPAPVMPRVYGGVHMDYADTVTTWDASRWTPDLVVIALGTNDFSDGAGPTPRPALDGEAFVRDYGRFVAGVRARYPRARMLLADSPMLDPARNERLREYLRRVIAERAAAGDTTIAPFSYARRYVAGCSGHPDLAEQARMADELEPAVRRWMSW
ncbi:MAG TPA: GDSL-type esterase/lipase family protein [Gemmatimonadaceae bacterium]|nr:GDSL-type esterase/lipase family protein [Gemmatimonadaceae bacterium]